MPFLNRPDLNRLIDLVDTEWGNDDLQSDVVNILAKADSGLCTPEQRAAAVAKYATNDIEIDDVAAVSHTDTGYWCAAWVFVPVEEKEQ